MSAIFYEAMRTLPTEYANDKTRHTYNADAVFVVNPELPPIMYTADRGWRKMDLVPAAERIIPRPSRLS